MTTNYDRAIHESVQALQLYDINQVPIDLNKILERLSLSVKCCPYSLLSRKTGYDTDYICRLFDSNLGAVAYDRKKERYIIYYNDTNNNKGLERFTIAHELGHIFLRHHQDANTDILLRKNICSLRYQKYENEANCFARNLLSPIPLVERITDIKNESSIYDIMTAFDISYTAATTRRDLFLLDKHRIIPEYYHYFNNFNIDYGYYPTNEIMLKLI